MGKTIVGYIAMKSSDGTFRGRRHWRDGAWFKEKTKAQIFKTEKSARMAAGMQTDTPEFSRWKVTGNQYWWRYPGRRYIYDHTGQEFIPVYADD